MSGNSRSIESSQVDIDENLPGLIIKRKSTHFKKPIEKQSQDLFDELLPIINSNKKVILDSGCGVGESSYNLAKEYPESFIIGIDKSLSRINRKSDFQEDNTVTNYKLICGDVIDLWRLFSEHKCKFDKHYILYPNPWPKREHLSKRWQGHPVFEEMLSLSSQIILRSNWDIYLKEFEYAALEYRDYEVQSSKFVVSEAITPFERKFLNSNQDLFELILNVK